VLSNRHCCCVPCNCCCCSYLWFNKRTCLSWSGGQDADYAAALLRALQTSAAAATGGSLLPAAPLRYDRQNAHYPAAAAAAAALLRALQTSAAAATGGSLLPAVLSVQCGIVSANQLPLLLRLATARAAAATGGSLLQTALRVQCGIVSANQPPLLPCPM
jgi:hypothetical protein